MCVCVRCVQLLLYGFVKLLYLIDLALNFTFQVFEVYFLSELTVVLQDVELYAYLAVGYLSVRLYIYAVTNALPSLSLCNEIIKKIRK